MQLFLRGERICQQQIGQNRRWYNDKDYEPFYFFGVKLGLGLGTQVFEKIDSRVYVERFFFYGLLKAVCDQAQEMPLSTGGGYG